MKILVTGNLGYVGPWVTRQLRARYPEATLVGFDAGYFAHSLTDVRRVPEAVLDAQYYGDVRHFPSALLKGVDAVVHLAAISNDPIGNLYEGVTLDVNYRASVAIAEMAKAAGVGSFVFASSCSVYGFADDQARTERSDVGPLTAYAKSKVLTEEGLKPLSGPEFQVSCLRFATACGMSDRLRLDLVLNDFVAGAISSKQITVLSDGSPWRPLINVSDMALAIEWAIGRDQSTGSSFLIVNVGSDVWNYQVRELAAAVAAAVPGTSVSINQNAPPDKRSYRVDFSLYKSLAPAHQPQADLASTVAGLQRGLQAMNFRDPDFRNSSFMRLQVIADLRKQGLLNDALEWSDRSGTRAAASEAFAAAPNAR